MIMVLRMFVFGGRERLNAKTVCDGMERIARKLFLEARNHALKHRNEALKVQAINVCSL